MTALVTRGGEATESVGEEIGRQLRAGDLVVLAGELGAGIFGGVFERQGPGDDLAAGILCAGGFLVL